VIFEEWHELVSVRLMHIGAYHQIDSTGELSGVDSEGLQMNVSRDVSTAPATRLGI
jgi:hypothetical protein